jgi:hypothetical protein
MGGGGVISHLFKYPVVIVSFLFYLVIPCVSSFNMSYNYSGGTESETKLLLLV